MFCFPTQQQRQLATLELHASLIQVRSIVQFDLHAYIDQSARGKMWERKARRGRGQGSDRSVAPLIPFATREAL